MLDLKSNKIIDEADVQQSSVGIIDEADVPQSSVGIKRGRCYNCLDSNDSTGSERKKAQSNAVTTKKCSVCKHFVCSKHSNSVCNNCL